MRTTFFKKHGSSPTRSNHSSASSPSSPLHPNYHHTLSDELMRENLDIAHTVIAKWETEPHTHVTAVTSIFNGDRRDSKEYLRAVTDLQAAMHLFVKEEPGSEKIIRAQHLMQMAMKRLEKEFYQILSSNRENLDAESVSNRSSRVSARSSVSDIEDEAMSELDDEMKNAEETLSEKERVLNLVMSDLKGIAECMISSGYGKECIKIYKVIRKSIVDEGLYNLGVERLTFAQIHKMDWEVVEPKIKHWLHAVKVAVKTLFYGERILCEHVFQSSPSILESCFTEVSTEGAMLLFGFPELVAKCKTTPEKMFRTLDIYEAIADLWPEIESIFLFESTSIVRSQTVTSLVKLADAVRIMLTEFESAIQKDSSKAAVPGGGIHPLTRYVMNYVSFLAEYSAVLSDIVVDWQLTIPNSLPGAFFEAPESNSSPTSAISSRIAWLILVLLCKLDVKAELHKDVALSYLFLANNLNYVVVKVRTSNLQFLHGDDWLNKHEMKVKQNASNYERMAWNKVFSSLPADLAAQMSPEIARDHFRNFNMTFEGAYRRQSAWTVPDSKLREIIKVSIARKLITKYREFYEKYKFTQSREMNNEPVVRFAPDDLDNYLSDLFHGNGVSGGSTSHGLRLH